MAKSRAPAKKNIKPEIKPIAAPESVCEPQDDIVRELEKIARMDDMFVIMTLRDPHARAYLKKVLRKAQEEIKECRHQISNLPPYPRLATASSS